MFEDKAYETRAGIQKFGVVTITLDTLTTWRETRQSGSVKELYRGCLLTVAGGAPYAAVFHTAFWASAHALAGLPEGPEFEQPNCGHTPTLHQSRKIKTDAHPPASE